MGPPRQPPVRLIKLDENLPSRLAGDATELGWDADTVRDEGMAGASDASVLASCRTERRVLITLDAKLADLRALDEGDPGVVVLRPPSQSEHAVRRMLRAFLEDIRAPGQLHERVTVVEPGRIRYRPLPDRS